MKKFNKNLMGVTSVIVFVLGLIGPSTVLAATSPSLGSSSTYGIISSTYTNSLNAGLETAITGDVCYTTPPGTAPVSISGATVVPCASARGTDQGSALADINGQSCTLLGANVNLSGTYTPGCYYSTGTMDIVLSTTVTLNGTGTYIFRSGGALTTGADSVVALTGGASACDVFWAPTGLASIGANASTSVTPTFIGNIIANALGSTGITLGHFVNLLGRLLSFGHTVTTDSNTITVPTCAASAPILHVIKHVVNNDGGSATANLWNLAITSSNGGSGTGNASGAESATTYVIEAGKQYSVAESGGPSGYSASSSSDCTIANAVAGTSYTCTITNDDADPFLTLTKIVTNDNGGNRTVADFPLTATGATTITGISGAGAITSVQVDAGTYTLSETNQSGYDASLWSCVKNGGSAVEGSSISLALGDTATCTITNNDIQYTTHSSSPRRIITPPVVLATTTTAPIVDTVVPTTTPTPTLPNTGFPPKNNMELYIVIILIGVPVLFFFLKKKKVI